MRILVLDPSCASLDWTMRCQEAGHQVKWVASNVKLGSVGKGIVERVDLHDYARWPDLVFYTDNTKHTHLVPFFRDRGVAVVGPTVEAADWELNRGTGQAILKKHGIATADSKVFTDYDAAIRFVTKEMKRFVSKPSGDADKALSYCAKSPADMVYMLQRWKKLGKLKAPFIIQEFIPGIEMAVGGWFGPGGFNEGWCENWEFKKLMTGDMGVATGEQGTVVRYVKRSRLAEEVLRPVEEALDALGYVGYVDVNCIIDDKGTPWPLEFTMRPGWPTFNIQQALNQGDPAEWLMDLASGRDARTALLDTVALGVVMSIPDYPYSHITRKEVTGIPLYGVTPSIKPFLHPCEMMMGEAPHEEDGRLSTKPCLCTAGDYVLVATGLGESVREAKRGAHRVLKALSMPNSPMWRTDIGDRLKGQLPDLKAMGYATGLEY